MPDGSFLGALEAVLGQMQGPIVLRRFMKNARASLRPATKLSSHLPRGRSQAPNAA